MGNQISGALLLQMKLEKTNAIDFYFNMNSDDFQIIFKLIKMSITLPVTTATAIIFITMSFINIFKKFNGQKSFKLIRFNYLLIVHCFNNLLIFLKS